MGHSQWGEKCLHELFEAQVDVRPHSTALVFGKQSYTYQELEVRANQLAAYLRSCGVGPGHFIAIYFERSAHPIVAILACLKSGAAYVPLDSAYPPERMLHILTESNVSLVLSEMAFSQKILDVLSTQELIPVVCLDAPLIQNTLTSLPHTRQSRQVIGVKPQDLCYVIYTSGTTGKPKGVMTVHEGACRFVEAFNQVCATSESDRVYQGFSLTFDGSVEEIWMAFSNGSALVVGDSQAPRFGNELGQYLAQNGITYFSTVPTLLSTIAEPIASLRTLVVSGEACPVELVNRWVPSGVRMFNVYGPTEATVNTTYAECRVGEPVTIGRPLEGYELYLFNEEFKPVQRGEKGELFVSGKTLARGYLKQPKLTAERFVQVPGMAGILYRTGDLVRWNENGDYEFFGRIDTQVKIRGFRVELSEIEAVLLEHSAVQSAVVKLLEKDGLQELAAYVVLHANVLSLNRNEILNLLEARLPPYMIPGFLDVLSTFPMLTSGKADRSRFPKPQLPLVREGRKKIPPATKLEEQVEGIWARVFGLESVSVEDDFFLDLGGHSLLAAQMVTLLREETQCRVTVRDAYSYSTIRALAAQLEKMQNFSETPKNFEKISLLPVSSKHVFSSQPKWIRRVTYALQAISVFFQYSLVAIPIAGVFIKWMEWLQGQISFLHFIHFFFLLSLLTWPVLVLISIAAKWVLIGRYQPGRYPLWGFYYFRWWLVHRLQHMSGVTALAGTPLLALYFRAMGARVGRGCVLDSAHGCIWDLLSIGDETSIGADTQFLGYRVEDGMLHIGSVDIGSRCFVGIHSVLGLNVCMADDSRLDDQSLLPDQTSLLPGECCRGSPAQTAPVPIPLQSKAVYLRSKTELPVAFGILQFALLELLRLSLLLPLLPLLALAYWSYQKSGAWGLLISSLASVPLSTVLFCLYFALLKKAILPRLQPGIYPVKSFIYLRKWLSDQLMKLSRQILLPLYTTLYLPPWLRLMGAKIGARAELSTVWSFSPELVEIGEESFFADGSMIGGKRFFRGYFEVGMNHIGRRSFVGNSAVLPVGRSLGKGCLLGVQSLPPETVPEGTDWLGSPSFSLPHRQKVGGFDVSVTFQPTMKLYFERALIDAARIMIPGFIAIGDAFVASVAFYEIYTCLGTLVFMALAPWVLMGLATFSGAVVVVIKKITMGTFQPVIQPLWSRYVWFNEMVNGIYESVMTPLIAPLLGTPWIAIPLRAMGCKIGNHTFIETTLFSEFDLVQIGDYAALNQGAVIQNHLFEDRVMKSSFLKIGEECSVGNLAVVLYDSEMKKGSTLGPLSLLMKGETFSPNTCWNGIPAVQVSLDVMEAREMRFRSEEYRVRGLRVETDLLNSASSYNTDYNT